MKSFWGHLAVLVLSALKHSFIADRVLCPCVLACISSQAILLSLKIKPGCFIFKNYCFFAVRDPCDNPSICDPKAKCVFQSQISSGDSYTCSCENGYNGDGKPGNCRGK